MTKTKRAIWNNRMNFSANTAVDELFVDGKLLANVTSTEHGKFVLHIYDTPHEYTVKEKEFEATLDNYREKAVNEILMLLSGYARFIGEIAATLTGSNKMNIIDDGDDNKIIIAGPYVAAKIECERHLSEGNIWLVTPITGFAKIIAKQSDFKDMSDDDKEKKIIEIAGAEIGAHLNETKNYYQMLMTILTTSFKK